MSEHMKKPRTRESKKENLLVFFETGGQARYIKVPLPVVKLIKEQLVPYKEEKSSWNWRDEFSDVLEEVGGKKEFQSASLAIRTLRKGKGMSQKELAKKISVEQGYVSKMEHAKIPIGKTVAKRLEKIFNIHYKVFLSD